MIYPQRQLYHNSEHRLYVGQLTRFVTEDDLIRHFSQWGELCECTLKYTMKKRPQYFAFISYQDRKFASNCLKAKHVLRNSLLLVKPAIEFMNLVEEDWVIPSKLFVGALPIGCDREQLVKAFEIYGEIQGAMIMADRRTGKSRLFGFVQFVHHSSIDKVLDNYWDHCIDNKWVETKRCVPKLRVNLKHGRPTDPETPKPKKRDKDLTPPSSPPPGFSIMVGTPRKVYSPLLKENIPNEAHMVQSEHKIHLVSMAKKNLTEF